MGLFRRGKLKGPQHQQNRDTGASGADLTWLPDAPVRLNGCVWDGDGGRGFVGAEAISEFEKWLFNALVRDGGDDPGADQSQGHEFGGSRPRRMHTVDEGDHDLLIEVCGEGDFSQIGDGRPIQEVSVPKDYELRDQDRQQDGIDGETDHVAICE